MEKDDIVVPKKLKCFDKFQTASSRLFERNDSVCIIKNCKKH